MGMWSNLSSGVKKMFGAREKDFAPELYQDFVPRAMDEGRVISGTGGVQNIRSLMESRGEVSGLSKDFELAEIERARGTGQNRAQSAAFRSGLGVSGAANARYRGVDQAADIRRQEAVARWRREAEQRRRDDITQIYLPYANQYLEASWRRVQGLAGIKSAVVANRTNAIKGIFNSMGGSF